MSGYGYPSYGGEYERQSSIRTTARPHTHTHSLRPGADRRGLQASVVSTPSREQIGVPAAVLHATSRYQPRSLSGGTEAELGFSTSHPALSAPSAHLVEAWMQGPNKNIARYRGLVRHIPLPSSSSPAGIDTHTGHDWSNNRMRSPALIDGGGEIDDHSASTPSQNSPGISRFLASSLPSAAALDRDLARYNRFLQQLRADLAIDGMPKTTATRTPMETPNQVKDLRHSNSSRFVATPEVLGSKYAKDDPLQLRDKYNEQMEESAETLPVEKWKPYSYNHPESSLSFSHFEHPRTNIDHFDDTPREKTKKSLHFSEKHIDEVVRRYLPGVQNVKKNLSHTQLPQPSSYLHLQDQGIAENVQPLHNSSGTLRGALRSSVVDPQDEDQFERFNSEIERDIESTDQKVDQQKIIETPYSKIESRSEMHQDVKDFSLVTTPPDESHFIHPLVPKDSQSDRSVDIQMGNSSDNVLQIVLSHTADLQARERELTDRVLADARAEIQRARQEADTSNKERREDSHKHHLQLGAALHIAKTLLGKKPDPELASDEEQEAAVDSQLESNEGSTGSELVEQKQPLSDNLPPTAALSAVESNGTTTDLEDKTTADVRDVSDIDSGANLKDMLDKEREEKESLLYQLELQKNETVKWEDRCSSLENELDNLKCEKEGLIADLRNIGKDRSESIERCKKLEITIGELESKLKEQSLESKVEQVSSSQDYTRQIDDLNQHLQRLKDENEGLIEKLRVSEKELVDLRRDSDLLISVSVEVEDLRRRYSELNSSLAPFEDVKRRNIELEELLEETAKQLHQAKEMLELKQEECDEVKQSLVSQEGLRKLNDSLETGNEVLSVKVDLLSAELRKANESDMKLRQEYDELKDKLDLQTESNVEVQDVLERLKSVQNELANCSKDLESSRIEIEGLRSDIDVLQNKLANAATEAVDSEENQKRLQKEVESLKAALEANHNSIRDQISAEQESKKSQEMQEMLVEKLALSQAECKELEEVQKDLTNEIVILRDQLKDHAEAASKAESQTELTLLEMKKFVVMHQEIVDELQSQLVLANQKITDLDEQLITYNDKASTEEPRLDQEASLDNDSPQNEREERVALIATKVFGDSHKELAEEITRAFSKSLEVDDIENRMSAIQSIMSEYINDSTIQNEAAMQIANDRLMEMKNEFETLKYEWVKTEESYSSQVSELQQALDDQRAISIDLKKQLEEASTALAQEHMKVENEQKSQDRNLDAERAMDALGAFIEDGLHEVVGDRKRDQANSSDALLDLRDDLIADEAFFADSQQSVDDLEREIERLNADLLYEQEFNSTQATRIAELESGIESLELEKRDFEVLVQELRSALESEKETQETKPMKLPNPNFEQQLETQDESIEVDRKQETLQKGLVHELESLKSEHSTLLDLVSDLENRLSVSNSSEEGYLQEIDRMKASYKELENVVDKLNDELEKRKQELGDVAFDKNVLKSELDEVKQKLEELKQEASIANAKFEEKTKELQECEENLETFRQDLNLYKSEIEEHVSDLKIAEHQLADNQHLALVTNQELQECRLQLQDLESELDENKRELDESKDTISERNMQIEEYKRELHATKLDLERCREELDGLTTELRNTHSLMSTNEQEIEDSRNFHRELINQKEDAETRLIELSSAFEQQNKAVEGLKLAYDEDVRNFRSVLEEEQQRNEEQIQKINELSSQLVLAEGALSNLEKARLDLNAKLMEEREQHEIEAEGLREQIRELEQVVLDNEVKHNELQVHLSEIRDQLSRNELREIELENRRSKLQQALCSVLGISDQDIDEQTLINAAEYGTVQNQNGMDGQIDDIEEAEIALQAESDEHTVSGDQDAYVVTNDVKLNDDSQTKEMLLTRIAELEQYQSTLADEAARLTTDHELMKRQLTDEKDEALSIVSKLTDAIQALEEERVQSLMKLADSEERIKEFKSVIQELQESLIQQEKEAQAYKDALPEDDGSTPQSDNSDEENVAIPREAQGLDGENADTTLNDSRVSSEDRVNESSQSLETETLSASLEQARAEVEKLRQERIALESFGQDLAQNAEQALEKVNRLESELEIARSDLEDLKLSELSLRSKCDELQRALEEKSRFGRRQSMRPAADSDTGDDDVLLSEDDELDLDSNDSTSSQSKTEATSKVAKPRKVGAVPSKSSRQPSSPSPSHSLSPTLLPPNSGDVSQLIKRLKDEKGVTRKLDEELDAAMIRESALRDQVKQLLAEIKALKEGKTSIGFTKHPDAHFLEDDDDYEDDEDEDEGGNVKYVEPNEEEGKQNRDALLARSKASSSRDLMEVTAQLEKTKLALEDALEDITIREQELVAIKQSHANEREMLLNKIVEVESSASAAVDASAVHATQLANEIQMREAAELDLQQEIEKRERLEQATEDLTQQYERFVAEASTRTKHLYETEDALSVAKGQLSEAMTKIEEYKLEIDNQRQLSEERRAETSMVELEDKQQKLDSVLTRMASIEAELNASKAKESEHLGLLQDITSKYTLLEKQSEQAQVEIKELLDNNKVLLDGCEQLEKDLEFTKSTDSQTIENLKTEVIKLSELAIEKQQLIDSQQSNIQELETEIQQLRSVVSQMKEVNKALEEARTESEKVEKLLQENERLQNERNELERQAIKKEIELKEELVKSEKLDAEARRSIEELNENQTQAEAQLNNLNRVCGELRKENDALKLEMHSKTQEDEKFKQMLAEKDKEMLHAIQVSEEQAFSTIKILEEQLVLAAEESQSLIEARADERAEHENQMRIAGDQLVELSKSLELSIASRAAMKSALFEVVQFALDSTKEIRKLSNPNLDVNAVMMKAKQDDVKELVQFVTDSIQMLSMSKASAIPSLESRNENEPKVHLAEEKSTSPKIAQGSATLLPLRLALPNPDTDSDTDIEGLDSPANGNNNQEGLEEVNDLLKTIGSHGRSGTPKLVGISATLPHPSHTLRLVNDQDTEYNQLLDRVQLGTPSNVPPNHFGDELLLSGKNGSSRSSSRGEAYEDVPELLRETFVRFLSEDEQDAFIPVLSKMLRLTPQQIERVAKARETNKSKGLFGNWL